MIISEETILSALKKGGAPSQIRDVLAKAKELKGLTIEETALLLNSESIDLLEETALEIKRRIYGNRMVLFAPLYISNFCTGGCLYCGYRADNSALNKRMLSKEEIVKEVSLLEEVGHKRILLVSGDHPICSFDKILEAIDTISSVKTKPHGEIRRINLEIPSLTEEEFARLRSKIGTYTLFQETYHRETYRKMHPYGRKANYDWRLETMDRAMRNGVDDVGIGVLFGLYDYKFEVLALLMHANHLEQQFNAGPHTISVPRINPAPNTAISSKPPHPVSDKEFKKLVAILRCAVPYTGIILSTRESAAMRKEVYFLGVSQISAGSHTEPGGYSNPNQKSEQFSIQDSRPMREVIKELLQLGFIPSWCTACYRKGRTGKHFMDVAKKGNIHNYCHPNALLTLSEYLIDYADKETQKIGWQLIEKEASGNCLERIQRIKAHERDLYF